MGFKRPGVAWAQKPRSNHAALKDKVVLTIQSVSGSMISKSNERIMTERNF